MQSAASHHRTRAPAASLHSGLDLRRTLSPWVLAGQAGWTLSARRPSHLQTRPTPGFQSPSGSMSHPLAAGSNPCRPARLLVGAGQSGHYDRDHHSTIGQGRADRDGIGETCCVSTMQQDLHTLLHMRGSLDRRMLYVGVAHLVSSNFCPLLEAHSCTGKVVRRSAQVVLGLIYPRYPSLPSPPHQTTYPCLTFASLLARRNSAHMCLLACTVRSPCGPPWSVLSSIQLRSLVAPRTANHTLRTLRATHISFHAPLT